MIQAYDRCGLGKPIALYDDETHPRPPLLEFRVKRSRTYDQTPELVAEQLVNPTVLPPALPPASVGARRLAGFRNYTHDVFLQDLENFRNTYKHGDPARV